MEREGEEINDERGSKDINTITNMNYEHCVRKTVCRSAWRAVAADLFARDGTVD